MYVYVPATFAGMSMRGNDLPTTWYWLTAFERPMPGAVPNGDAAVAPVFAAVICVENSLPPRRSPYLTDFPPPETTPLATDRLEAGTPSCVAARPSSVVFARAAAERM